MLKLGQFQENQDYCCSLYCKDLGKSTAFSLQEPFSSMQSGEVEEPREERIEKSSNSISYMHFGATHALTHI